MLHIVGKLSTRVRMFFQTFTQLEICKRSYGAPKSQESQFRDKMTFGAGPVAKHRGYYKEEGGDL
jgi:hypothetical protein